MIVIDASVFGKLILDEPDSAEAQALVAYGLAEGGLIAPSLLLYETLSIALCKGVSFRAAYDLLQTIRDAGLELFEPTAGEIMKAEEMATTGTKAAGYPDFADSIYHAMAISRGGVFVTADRRHTAKTSTFGSIVLLADWRAPDRQSR